MDELKDIVETPESAPLLLWWQWALIGITATIILLAVRYFLKKRPEQVRGVNSLQTSLKELKKIEQSELNNNQLTTKLSILTRHYLQHQFKDQAIFETHQEFQARYNELDRLPENAREKLAIYLETLAKHKYSPEHDLPAERLELINLTEHLLRGMDSTIPKSI